MSVGPHPVSVEGHVLVVDDDADIRESVSEVLEISGFRVTSAANGAEALERLRDGTRPTVILLDLMMPVMDGRQFRAEQRRDPAMADIPVVIFSAHSHVDEAAVQLGAAGTLTKPVRIDTLVSVLGAFTAAARRERP